MNEIETLFLKRFTKMAKRGMERDCHEFNYTAKIDPDNCGIGLMLRYEIDFEVFKKEHISGHVFILPQYKIGSYTVDFMITGNIGGFIPALVIEIDGHEWHEKTKEQAARDKKRERSILLDIQGPQGPASIMRFTGSEIYNNAKDPYYDIFDFPVCYSVSQGINKIINESDEYEEKMRQEEGSN